MCGDLSFTNTRQQTLISFQKNKMFEFPGWMRKNFVPENVS